MGTTPRSAFIAMITSPWISYLLALLEGDLIIIVSVAQINPLRSVCRRLLVA
jgi:hypothetical protein